MRYIALVLSFILLGIPAYAADYDATNSTNPVSASTLSVISQAGPGDILVAILVNKRAPTADNLTVYDSSGAASGSLGVIDTSTGSVITSNEYWYNLRISSGITFTKSASLSDMTIIWKNVR